MSGNLHVEPEHYEIDLSLEGPKLLLRGKTRLHLRAFERSNALTLRIAPDLRIDRVRLDGLELYSRQTGGRPEIYYRYEFEPSENGKWRVRGQARQRSAWRYQYRVVRKSDGSHDVKRERLDPIEARGSWMVVPFQVAVYDPEKKRARTRKKRAKAGKKAGGDSRSTGNVLLQGQILFRGTTTPISIELDHEPKEFSLDGKKEVLGRFHDERRQPKRRLYHQGLDLAAAGDHARAEEIFLEALRAEAFSASAHADAKEEDREAESRSMDSQIYLALARLYLDEGRVREATVSSLAVHVETPLGSRYRMEDQLRRLKARLAIHGGDYELAYRLLLKEHRGGTGHVEGLLLFAIAARETGHSEELESAIRAAEEKGADVAALRSGSTISG